MVTRQAAQIIKNTVSLNSGATHLLNENPIGQEVRAFVLEHFPLARHKHVSDTDSLVESGIVDSLGVLEIVTFLEARFGIVVADVDVVSENFLSIAAIANYVESKQQPSSTNQA